MGRKLATIRTIDEVQPIEGADAIEKVRLGGWWCVSKKGEFKTGDTCIYFEIDSLLPPVEPFLFLERNGRKKVLFNGKEYEGYRLKTLKLRGQLSQGLALPLRVFNNFINVTVGDDVSEILDIIKYEAPIPASLGGDAKGAFPCFIPKTDEERIQNIPEVLKQHRDSSFTLTEKVDGTSCTIYKTLDGQFGVCGRNWEYLDTEKNIYWRMAKKYDLEKNLKNGCAIQAEIIGEGIQSNPLKINGQELRVFYIYHIPSTRYLTPEEMIDMAKELNVPTVPIIDQNFILNHDVNQLLSMADRKSLVNPNQDAEGIVFRLNDKLNYKVSFKAISNKYLLKDKN